MRKVMLIATLVAMGAAWQCFASGSESPPTSRELVIGGAGEFRPFAELELVNAIMIEDQSATSDQITPVTSGPSVPLGQIEYRLCTIALDTGPPTTLANEKHIRAIVHPGNYVGGSQKICPMSAVDLTVMYTGSQVWSLATTFPPKLE